MTNDEVRKERRGGGKGGEGEIPRAS